MTDDNIRALAVAPRGSLWVATDGGGLLHYQRRPLPRLRTERRARQRVCRRGAGGSHGRHLGRRPIADCSAAMASGSSASTKRCICPTSLSSACASGATARVFAGGPAGLFCFENGSLRPLWRDQRTGGPGLSDQRCPRRLPLAGHQPRPAHPRTNPGRTVGRPRRQEYDRRDRRGPHGNMWLGTVGDGLYPGPERQETAFRAPAHCPNNSVSALLEDREQNIWVGTADGLVRMSAPDVSVLNSRDGLSDDNISTIYCDRRGALWLTTVTGKIVRYAERPHRGASDLPRARRRPALSRDLRGPHRRILVRHRQSGRGAPRQRQGHAVHHRRRAAQQRLSGLLRGPRRQSVDRHHQRAQPLGRRAFPELLSARRASRTAGCAPSSRTTTATCWWAPTAASIAFTTAGS